MALAQEPPPFRLLSVFLAAKGLVLVAACVPIEPAGAASTVVQHSATVSDTNALIAEVRVSLSRPARVFVEYDNPLAGRYRTRLEAPATEHNISIVRLRPETTYDYTVFTVERLGESARGPSGSFTTGALPHSLASIFTVAEGRSSEPLILTDYKLRAHGSARFSYTDSSTDSYFVFWDEVGALVWYLRPDNTGPVARRPGEHNFIFVPWLKGLAQFTPLGEVTDLAIDVGQLHHELVLLDEGRVLVPTTISDHFDRNGLRTPTVYDSLVTWHSATGRVEEMWNAREAWDILDPAQHWEPADSNGVLNWTHLNAVIPSERGNFLLSFRNRSQVVSLTPDYKIEWQLHGPDSDYEFPDPTDRFYGQHTATQLANGNVLLFDNGRRRPDAEGGKYSRALELRLDDAAGTAVKAWEYRPDPDIYAPSRSSAYRLDGGNTLVNFGFREEEHSQAPLVVVEVDADGNEVFRIETVQLHAHPIRYRAYGGFETIYGETMLRPPTEFVQRPPTARLHYQRMTHVAAETFDIYLEDGHLVYAKAPCTTADIEHPFFLHVVPKRSAVLPADRRQFGFVNLDFNFLQRGMRWQGSGQGGWQGKCHAEVPLPEFEIDLVRTGQFAAEDEATGRRNHPNGAAAAPWSVEISPDSSNGGGELRN